MRNIILMKILMQHESGCVFKNPTLKRSSRRGSSTQSRAISVRNQAKSVDGEIMLDEKLLKQISGAYDLELVTRIDLSFKECAKHGIQKLSSLEG